MIDFLLYLPCPDYTIFNANTKHFGACVQKAGLIRINADITALDVDITIDGEGLKALKMWKPRISEAVSIVDKTGNTFRARVMSLNADTAAIRVFEEMTRQPEDAPAVTLFQSMPDKERMELIIQKATELGVDVIVPVETKKSTTVRQREAYQRKSHKWPEVALKAAKQCRRTDIPDVAPCIGFEGAITHGGSAELKIILDSSAGAPHIKKLLRGLKDLPKSAAILVGPEGGFDAEEIAKAKNAGFVCASLGQRILRTETAAITAISIILYELG